MKIKTKTKEEKTNMSWLSNRREERRAQNEEIARGNIEDKNNESKSALKAKFVDVAKRVEDDDVKDGIFEFCKKIQKYPTSAVESAKDFDARVGDVIVKYLEGSHNVVTDSILKDVVSVELRRLMHESNRAMFITCARVIEEQMETRRKLMRDKQAVDGKLWKTAFATLEFAMEKESLLCKIKCVQVQMDYWLQKSIEDPTNASTYDSNYNKYFNQQARLREREQILNNRIAQVDDMANVIELVAQLDENKRIMEPLSDLFKRETETLEIRLKGETTDIDVHVTRMDNVNSGVCQLLSSIPTSPNHAAVARENIAVKQQASALATPFNPAEEARRKVLEEKAKKGN